VRATAHDACGAPQSLAPRRYAHKKAVEAAEQAVAAVKNDDRYAGLL
jgi:hypothetical protein